jgi:hypothetical protein
MFEFNGADSVAKYDQVLATEPKTRDQPARSIHVCYELPGGGFGVLDVWDSEEAFAKFGEILMPVLDKVGLVGEPRVLPVHNVM